MNERTASLYLDGLLDTEAHRRLEADRTRAELDYQHARQGMEDTLRLAEQLASQGYHVAPHLSARLIEDSAHVEEILLRLHEVGIRDAFVVGATLRSPLASLLARLSCWSRCPGSGMSLRKSALPATRRATPSSKMRP
jgi:hypothetical protein